ncbi:MAG TPA: hypothetical protein VFK32_02225, partial [Tepidiformaceae bacterium]|nr:hypothetical protein [Tepidiformaceae bacterium]
RTVLSFPRDRDAIAAERGISRSELDARIDSMRTRLRAVRETRIAPGLDDKCLTSWNGLALAAFAEASRILGDVGYREIAEGNAAVIRAAMWDGTRLLHTWKDGVARVDGLLEDYAYYGLGLVELYKLTGDLAHLEWAAELLRAILVRFRDPEHGGFFESPVDGEALLLRQKPFFDSATPGENSAVAQLAWWLGRYYGVSQWEQVVEECASQVADHAVAAANGFGALLLACQIAQAPRREIVVVGEPASRAPFEAELAGRFLPGTLIAPGPVGTALPLFEGRGVEGAAAYVCEDMVCQLPATSPAAFAAQLG